MRLATAISGTLLLLTVALSGCGSDDADEPKGGSSGASSTDSGDSGDSGDSSGPLDACALLTPADLQEAFGSPFDKGSLTHQDQTGGDQCVWTNTDVPPVKTFSVTVMREGHQEGAIKSSGLSIKDLYDQTKAIYPDAEDQDLGDDAFLAKTELGVLDGDTFYTFSTFMGTSDEAIAGLKALAAQVVD